MESWRSFLPLASRRLPGQFIPQKTRARSPHRLYELIENCLKEGPQSRMEPTVALMREKQNPRLYPHPGPL